MKLLPTPEVTLTDSDVEDALGRAVAVINPLLDVLWGTDPFGLKRRTPPNAASWVLNAADVPGTFAWDDLSVDDKINWWVWRVGALNSVAVAFPGVLGVIGRRRRTRKATAPTRSVPVPGPAGRRGCGGLIPTGEESRWFHSQSRVLAALPKSAHPSALAAIKDIYNAEDIDKAQIAVKAFKVDFGVKYPRAVAKIVDDLHVLLEFYKYPAEHWIHPRTTNPIESAFATVRLRTKVTEGPGSRVAGIAMAYKMIDAAQARSRAVNAPHLVALVRAGAVFHKGKLLERPTNITPPTPPSDGDQQAGTEVA